MKILRWFFGWFIVFPLVCLLLIPWAVIMAKSACGKGGLTRLIWHRIILARDAHGQRIPYRAVWKKIIGRLSGEYQGI